MAITATVDGQAQAAGMGHAWVVKAREVLWIGDCWTVRLCAAQIEAVTDYSKGLIYVARIIDRACPRCPHPMHKTQALLQPSLTFNY
jgi:hypothetical protein